MLPPPLLQKYQKVYNIGKAEGRKQEHNHGGLSDTVRHTRAFTGLPRN